MARQRECIERPAITRPESNTRLTDIMRRGSETDFDKLIEGLNEMDQSNMNRILTEDGAVALIVTATKPANNEKHGLLTNSQFY